MALTPGTRLGAYEVLALLGSGGMGDVYRARDTRLGRTVAIKILRDTHPDLQSRFAREAKLIAALAHPHICTLFDIGHERGTDYLVMECLDGETLADRLKRGALPLDQALKTAIEIGDALDRAHRAGIVHRDLKPSNVMLAKAGAKLLDFGLAKFHAARQGVTGTITQLPLSGEGALAGTVPYMAPEQLEGRAADARSDLFAFGAVLYEMVSGRRAFAGESQSRVIAAILDFDPPPISTLQPRIPPAFDRVVRRCLVKDPEARWQTARDLIEELRWIAEGTRTTPDVPIAPPRRRWASVAWLVATVAVLAGLAGWFTRGASRTPENPLAHAQFTRFTDFEGAEHDAAISADGKFVSFVSDQDGQFDVWISQVGTGRFANLTKGKFPNVTSLISVAGFSGDGTEIWFHDSDTKQPLMLLPLMGGPARVFLSKSPAKMPPMNAIWSPDGGRLVYHTADDGDPMFIADRTGANPHQIFIDRPGIHNHFPAWSPDGRWIYYVGGSPIAADQDLWRIAPEGGQPQRLTHHESFVAYPAPIDPRTVLYVARDRDGSGPWLWALDVDHKVTQRVSFGLEQYISVAASADGRRLAATVANPTASLWCVPLGDRPAEERDVKSFPVPTVRALAPRFSGSALFYLSSHGTGDGLWRLQDGQAVELWRGSEGALASSGGRRR
jgi:eukaryotic-like serine/threonine-protein kinase